MKCNKIQIEMVNAQCLIMRNGWMNDTINLNTDMMGLTHLACQTRTHIP